MRGENTLDLVYTNIFLAQSPLLGYSDHMSVMLTSACRPHVRCTKLVQKQVKMWPEGATFALQDSFDRTDWEMFRLAATDGQPHQPGGAHSTSGQLHGQVYWGCYCYSKAITIRPHQKPWISMKPRVLMVTGDTAYKSGDEESRMS